VTAVNLAPYRDTCRSCGADIAWATTSGGRPMPVNLVPNPEIGNVALTVHKGTLLAGVLGRNQAAGARGRGMQLHTSHFVECPHADQHRKPR